MKRDSPVVDHNIATHCIKANMVQNSDGEFVKYADVPSGQEYYLLANNYIREIKKLRKQVADLKQLNIVLHDMLRQEYADNYARNEYSYARNGGDEE